MKRHLDHLYGISLSGGGGVERDFAWVPMLPCFIMFTGTNDHGQIQRRGGGGGREHGASGPHLKITSDYRFSLENLAPPPLEKQINPLG